MSCCGRNRIPPNMDNIIKSGFAQRYSRSVLCEGWRPVYLVYHNDTRLAVYKKQGNTYPQFTVYMRDVCRHFAYGEYTQGMYGRPVLPSGTSINCLMGVPTEPNQYSKIIWLLFPSELDLHEWMASICSALPPPPIKNAPSPGSIASEDPHPAASAPSVANNPPPYEQHQRQPTAPPAYTATPPLAGPYQGYPQPPTVGGYAPGSSYPPAPPPGPYPRQPYPQQYPPSPYGPAPPPQGVRFAAPQPAYYQQHPGVMGYPQQTPYMHQQQRGGGILDSTAGKVAAGALLGYGLSGLMGGGGGWGLGRWGSWDSVGSFGSGFL